MSEKVSFETMQSLLKEMQKEKSCLEENLQSIQNKKKVAQMNVQELNLKYNQMKEKNAKLRETLNVAQNMLEKSQSCQHVTQQELEKDQQCVDSLKAEIEQENAHHDEQSAAFQQELSDLANTFIAARKLYTSDNMENELSWLERERAQLKSEIDINSEATEYLNHELAQLMYGEDYHESDACGGGDIIDGETQQELLSDLTKQLEAHSIEGSQLLEEAEKLQEIEQLQDPEQLKEAEASGGVSMV